jgi:hypothetical protein
MASPMATMAGFEQQYRADHNREHGLLLDRNGDVIVERTGIYDQVAFEPEEFESARGGYLTHSHPRDLPPSGADLEVAATFDMTLRAVGIAPDTGQQFDHTVKMPDFPRRRIKEIVPAFNREMGKAQKELAKQPYGDLQWQRESRHLALQRLARDFGFIYRRVERNASLAEANRHERARLDTLNNVETVMRDRVFEPLHDEIIRNLSRLTVGDSIPIANIEQARQVVATLVQRTILGPATRTGSLQPYTVRSGEVIPHSLYFKVLWSLMREAGQVASNRQADLMRKYLPADLVRSLEYATVDPFGTDLSEMDDAPDLSGHDPLHLWTGPDGKRLIDRIWNVAGDMYRRLDTFISSAVARRVPLASIDKQLQAYLVDDKGSYEAMRLARTETAATYSRVDSAAASLNPIVETYQPFTSPLHKHVDVCDEQVAGGPYPANDTDHLPPYHPFCLCGVLWNMVEDIPAKVEQLQGGIARALAAGKKAFSDLIGPLSRRFLDLIFGSRSS